MYAYCSQAKMSAPASSCPTSLRTVEHWGLMQTDLERADECPDPGNLISLAIKQGAEQWRPQHDGRVRRGYDALEEPLEDCVRLYHIKLAPVHQPTRRLQQPSLKELNRRRDAKEERERNAGSPGAGGHALLAASPTSDQRWRFEAVIPE